MSRIKVIVSAVIATIALILFAGEAPVEMFPVQLAAGAVILAVLGINGAYKSV